MADAADATVVDGALAERWPDASCELYARDPWELLVAVILSARTADERVNQVMAVLNEHFTGPEAFADIDPRMLANVIRRVPLYNQKARAIVEAARAVVYQHGGVVPKTLAELVRMPGVGRKTAAVVVGNAFGVPAIAADQHVQRIAYRLGWTRREDARLAEESLAERFDESVWVKRCHQLIRLGRDCCRPKRPWCSRCPIGPKWCPQVDVSDSR